MPDPSDATDDTAGEPPDMDAVFEELEELETLVDTVEEREQVRETMRVLRRARRPRLVGRFRSAFTLRDAGEALVGSFLFGIPMVVEEGTLEVGRFISREVAFVAATLLFGFAIVYGILHAASFERVEEDFVRGIVPLRLVGILLIAAGTAGFLMTLWGRVDWTVPRVAASQTLVTAVVMAVGASLGDVLPED